MDFSKKLLVLDYLFLVILIVCSVIFTMVDFTTIIIAWVAQVGVSSAAYYWKAKNENRVKVPIKVVESLPENIRSNVDLTQVIISIIQSDQEDLYEI